MPHYTFRCEICGEVFERYLSFSQSLDGVSCPNGHTQVVRVYRPPAIVFKGSGFYITDHGRNGSHGSNGRRESSGETGQSTAKGAEGKSASPATSDKAKAKAPA